MQIITQTVAIVLAFLLLLAPSMAFASQSAATVWPASTPEQQGIDSARLADVFDDVRKENAQINSLLVVRNGHIVLDAAFYPYDPATVYDLASATKSLMGTLVGIAIDKGLIRDVNQPVLDFFPGRAVFGPRFPRSSETGNVQGHTFRFDTRTKRSKATNCLRPVLSKRKRWLPRECPFCSDGASLGGFG